MWNGAATLENRLCFVKHKMYTVSYNPAIPVPGIYPKEMKAYVYTRTFHECDHISFICIHQSWRLTKYFSVGE